MVWLIYNSERVHDKWRKMAARVNSATLQNVESVILCELHENHGC